jgi:hypothetical protein
MGDVQSRRFKLLALSKDLTRAVQQLQQLKLKRE